VLWARTTVRVLRVDGLRGKRKGQRNHQCCGESNQADSDTALICGRTSGTIGRSGG
jgi:hypothetical protein